MRTIKNVNGKQVKQVKNATVSVANLSNGVDERITIMGNNGQMITIWLFKDSKHIDFDIFAGVGDDVAVFANKTQMMMDRKMFWVEKNKDFSERIRINMEKVD
jgi:hypothetical protein